jgi:hypothetical protein
MRGASSPAITKSLTITADSITRVPPEAGRRCGGLV